MHIINMENLWKASILLILYFTISSSSDAQIIDSQVDESKLYAQSKQVNQFFRRFNGEEDEKGNRYYPKDKNYRSEKLRKKYLLTLFDEGNLGMSNTLKTEFVKDVLDRNEKSILNFHGKDWFSEVQATFALQGKPQSVTLFMKLEKDHDGYKWVISQVFADFIKNHFDRDTLKIGKFIHPLSHELDFMNLRKAFEQRDSISQFAAREFTPDHLSVFLYEIKKGNLKFNYVERVKFHFFQIEGWYFELSQFNRQGYNTGWLISNLVKVNNSGEKNLLQNFLYNNAK